MKKVILTTGGTGGHIYPALAVADSLKEKGVECSFIGTSHRMEKDILSKTEYRFKGLDIKPLSLKHPLSFFKMFKGILKAIAIIFKEKPDAIIGFGNYISVPMIVAGIIMRKKVYLQEQNANLGFANKLFYKYVEKTYLAFEKTYDDLPIKNSNKLKVTGNPLRKEVYLADRKLERERLKIEEEEKVMLITGGSLGAKSINEAMLKKWNMALENKKVRIYWATGVKNFEDINNRIEKYKGNDVIKPYFENMPNIMAAADIMVCRAGAITISEIVELGVPSILVPYQSIKVGQYENAKILEEVGAAYVHRNSEAELAIERAFDLLKTPKQTNSMKVQLKIMQKENAAEVIANDIDIWG